ENVSEFETKLLDFMTTAKTDVLQKIKKGEWNDEIEASLKQACEEFSK
ncbi:MAG: hypothetical protein COU33_01755, partial [Candidatus Magasanikbacteria bacterium CG10_big_fil_rev_8_21_14_0_10_43_6]